MWGLGLLAILVFLFGFVVFRGAPYVPSKRREVARAFEDLYRVGSQDVVVDIGSGDGVVLREAARRGARGVGYELNPLLVIVSWWLCRRYPGIRVTLADFWNVRLPDDTTVVYTFGDSRDIAKMAAKVMREAERLGHPLLFISYGFMVPGQTLVRTVGAHHLYRFDSLHVRAA